MSETAVHPDSIDMGTAALPGRSALDINDVRKLSERSDLKGFLRLGSHFLVMSATGTCLYFAQVHWYLLVPGMIAHGFTIVTLFAPMHECVHRTAFATRTFNEVFGWIAGVLSFYSFTYYRHYHTWHHRYTQDPEKDPELMTPKPQSLAGYTLEITGLPFWSARPALFVRLVLGRTQQYPFVPERARKTVAISTACQLTIYLSALVSIAIGYTWALYYWFLPVLFAQPMLRAITIAEHTGCTQDANGLTNTRTTLASFPVRLLMWNMPFHAEHHLYPSIPFHGLPRAHQKLKEKLTCISPGYASANLQVIRSLHDTVPVEPR